MRKLFSTDEVHPRDRFECWYDVACRNVATHDEVPESKVGFVAQMQAASLAEIRLISYKTSRRQIARTARHIKQGTDDELLIFRLISGQAIIEQNSRESMLEAGDITLLDPLLPSRVNYLTPENMLVLKVPRLALEARLGKTSQMVAVCIKPSDAEGGLTSSLLAMLPSYVDHLQGDVESSIKSNT